jgi:hypothetical protein
MPPIPSSIAHPIISQFMEEDIHILNSEIRIVKSEIYILKSENTVKSEAIIHISTLLQQAEQRTAAIAALVAKIEKREQEKIGLAAKKRGLEAQKEELEAHEELEGEKRKENGDRRG